MKYFGFVPLWCENSEILKPPKISFCKALLAPAKSLPSSYEELQVYRFFAKKFIVPFSTLSSTYTVEACFFGMLTCLIAGCFGDNGQTNLISEKSRSILPKPGLLEINFSSNLRGNIR
ncbi:hypothetical protein CONCODRAFT_9782 [Conidiobolus coronatus NRRL 28638]|uniref:Uncharacterized protein n=1 Tax=Conidiobolus coronatus (strain ATCC 28846 / CBS 209.66 / NRRL 28638) TaxID=796925 RepID=A0A137NZ06_CONC2|nr:hypothetical protein CONCODRAFT_9782 [Conidiobolus coronatus NRRL 28638]|eukprot:KXN68055.1 hypothetical protein CONCODRAFT_9782 [Conidiobolus coronatus NRRL 28638]